MSAVPAPSADSRPAWVIAVGASAGGVEVLRRLVAELPADLPAAICVVLHIPATGKSLLAPILAREGALRADVAEHGTPLQAGRIYVAPADNHLIVRQQRVELDHGPKENGARPAVDPLFRSAALSWGPRAIAVVLSGALDDGSSGAVTVAENGGTVIVQEPSDALVPSMPESALAATEAAHAVPADMLAEVLTRLVSETAPEEALVSSDPIDDALTRTRPEGAPSGFTCPECSGALWELREGELVRYQCRVGHTYSEDAFVDHQASTVEAALWTALEVLEERAELLQRIADRMGSRTPRSSRRFRAGAHEALNRAALIRRALTERGEAEAAVPDDVAEASAQ